MTRKNTILFTYPLITPLEHLTPILCSCYPLPTDLFNPHHSVHVAGGVPHRHARQAMIPVHEVVVDIASHKSQHVIQEWQMVLYH